MRTFESYIERHLGDKILYIDLASVNKRKNDRLYLNLGIKTKEKYNIGFIGTTWKTIELDVEKDFTMDEFKNICDKYGLGWSVFISDNETYGM